MEGLHLQIAPQRKLLIVRFLANLFRKRSDVLRGPPKPIYEWLKDETFKAVEVLAKTHTANLLLFDLVVKIRRSRPAHLPVSYHDATDLVVL